MADEKKEPKLGFLNLEDALAPFELPPEAAALAAAVVSVLGTESITKLDAVALARVDAVAVSRQAYVLALLRVVDYLRHTPASNDFAHKQAIAAIAYVRHIESPAGRKQLQMGRTVHDEKLEDTVLKLRAEVEQLAQDRAEAMAEPARRKAQRGQAQPN